MKKRGFTLIELLIVIAVISILIGIALPRFRGMREEGLIAQSKGELRTLQTAVESFYIHTGAYPAALTNLTSATPNIVGTTLPTDPFNGANNYGFADDGATPVNYYVIYSIGAGGNGSAAISAAGVVTETNGTSCIYASNGTLADTTP